MRILHIYCHPLPESFHAGIRAKALATLAAAGHQIDLLDLYAENSDPVLSEEGRALLVASIARGRRWLDELVSDPTANAEAIAKREGCSVRKVNMTISLAFLAPDLVKAAIDGRLPRSMGVARLCDMPAEWSHQHKMLGLSPR